MQRAAAYAAFILAALLECRATTPALFAMRSSKIAFWVCLGHRPISERGRWSLTSLYCVGSGMPIGESLLNVWFRRCSSVGASSTVSEFA
jgi:hypothetical protein